MDNFVILDLESTVVASYVTSVDPLVLDGNKAYALRYISEESTDIDVETLNSTYPGRFGSNPNHDPED